MVFKGLTEERPSPLRRFLGLLPPRLRRQKVLTALYRLGLVSPQQPIRFNGEARAWVDLRDAASRAVLLSGTFWREFHPMVAAFLRSGGDLFDVGANLGLVTFGTVPLVRNKGITFHLFEANPQLVPLLHRSAREYPDEAFNIVHGCVTDSPGVSYLFLPDAIWGNGRIDTHGTPVRNLRLDDYVAEHSIRSIGFLKLDVEGWEVHAIRGAERTLASGKVAAGYIEIAPRALSRAGTGATELLDLLDAAGFDAYFAAMDDRDDPLGLLWRRVPVNGTDLRFARATPLPSAFVQGDVLVIHRSTPLAAQVGSLFSQ